MSQNHQEQFNQLCIKLREIALVSSIDSLLNWDERTQIPKRGGEFRAQQATWMSGEIHRRMTDPALGELLSALRESPLADDPHSDAGTTIRRAQRTFEKQTQLPQRLVQELAHTSVLGQQTWAEARKKDDVASFASVLEKIVSLTREKADAYGYETCRYDALLDDFEPDEKADNVRRVFAGLREALVPLACAIAASERKPPEDVLRVPAPRAAQSELGRMVAALIGYDFDRGRLDETDHPFCTTLGPHDFRITTRYLENFFPSSLFSVLHEAGHAIYEQGLRGDWWGLPPGSTVSLGIHESQSRMWENLVGRSQAFWKHFYPQTQQCFEALAAVSLEDFYFAINTVKPTLIRVEADEATYSLHVIVRFELEQALLDGDLAVADLPGAWKEKYQHYLGIEPPNDTTGCLQDVHWSSGAIGYFPTYALGNLYAAQFFDAARRDLGDLDEQFAAGEFAPLKSWLNKNIHESGECYSATQLVEKVTGKALSHEPMIANLRAKFGELYGL